ncbi:2,3-dihydroxyphenylpropionate 1,2-dioxygenase [Blastococcus haudaquaticus]|uniref:2'-carboxy-2,3-dihydroxybiphenyl 1,2-dioxygenase large subunit/2'-aminobiphenyl-2,3-diol 1,2-dioxygenase, large subunit n=1 Tax=Blastococcus haudaquaticus TaxID=1938745 RepID=A0A286GV95_9ACTN|nr:2,3-dihydroxyphenylpropionate 1,2-dioxygenase [Blastococcus haudaquaticus]SOD99410.1 2'-carboxy-2,3-dihydroxybiphenyl 1,2-dioxygenase large subunit/2'-aminobiphenyl-2,3-diol 1,2-dioxygenase, large subunit [Blastococcus haudaquaticus]
MSGVAWAGATSHVGAILRNPHAAPERSDGLNAGWDAMAAEIRAARLDALVVVATDHYETFRLEHYPTFCVGVADEYEGWGEFGNPAGVVSGSPAISAGLLDGLVSGGFDVSRSHEMPLDHSFMVPLLRLGLGDLPIVPLFVNCNTPPLPSLARCVALGTALGRAAAALPGGPRLGVLGTGGVSHWVGLPRFGEVNEEWDGHFLDLMATGRVEEVLGWSDDEILADAGNGALEIRTWLVAQGAAGAAGGRLLGYAPMPEWAIGIGIMSMATP